MANSIRRKQAERKVEKEYGTLAPWDTCRRLNPISVQTAPNEWSTTIDIPIDRRIEKKDSPRTRQEEWQDSAGTLTTFNPVS